MFFEEVDFLGIGTVLAGRDDGEDLVFADGKTHIELNNIDFKHIFHKNCKNLPLTQNYFITQPILCCFW